jgi:hypothetical protein
MVRRRMGKWKLAAHIHVLTELSSEKESQYVRVMGKELGGLECRSEYWWEKRKPLRSCRESSSVFSVLQSET